MIGSRPVTIHWIPEHDACSGNEEADKLVRNATTHESTAPAVRAAAPLSIVKSAAKRCDIKPEHDAFATSTVGQFTRKIDRALPGKHTITL